MYPNISSRLLVDMGPTWPIMAHGYPIWPIWPIWLPYGSEPLNLRPNTKESGPRLLKRPKIAQNRGILGLFWEPSWPEPLRTRLGWTCESVRFAKSCSEPGREGLKIGPKYPYFDPFWAYFGPILGALLEPSWPEPSKSHCRTGIFGPVAAKRAPRTGSRIGPK